jgi:signal peptide peptidase SppA
MDYAASVRAKLEKSLTPHLLDIEAMNGMIPDDERKPYECIDGIAIVHITGLLTDEPSWWDETCYGDIQNEVEMAVADDAVTGILLVVNSPGGYTDGAFECASALYAAGKKKPMYGVAASSAYSAGYLQLAQCERVFAPPITGGVGSIGVYMAHADYSKMLEQAGINVTLISAGAGKTDGTPYKPLSKEALARFQSEVTRLYGEFTGAVARGRNMTADAVVALGAHTFAGPAALTSKLVDAHGSVTDAWAALVQATQKQTSFVSNVAGSAAMNSSKEATTMADTVAELNTAEQLTAAEERGTARATEIAQLCTLAGKTDAIAGFLGSKKSVAEIRAELLATMAANQSAEIDGRAKGTGMRDTKGAASGDIPNPNIYDPINNPFHAAVERSVKSMKGVQ